MGVPTVTGIGSVSLGDQGVELAQKAQEYGNTAVGKIICSRALEKRKKDDWPWMATHIRSKRDGGGGDEFKATERVQKAAEKESVKSSKSPKEQNSIVSLSFLGINENKLRHMILMDGLDHVSSASAKRPLWTSKWCSRQCLQTQHSNSMASTPNTGGVDGGTQGENNAMTNEAKYTGVVTKLKRRSYNSRARKIEKNPFQESSNGSLNGNTVVKM
ncbi:hypothetical protein BDV93DRAFT_516325 [Ceratobasidium sp. AG-I]|nr:hypothetical protein BDV93DRAFT_516325 [Ceratobasidium sp. AG-I]